ncbi:MAG: PAS domain S-box protein, partial [Methanoculleus sp.]|nr:PAS domain S-box protein [Methanoculleus sp.]
METLSEADLRSLYEELRVHQIELELQSEELRAAKQETLESEEKYRDFYDFGLLAYFTFTGSGVIEEANLAGAELLNKPRRFLSGWPFQSFLEPGSVPIFTSFCRRVMEGGEKEIVELSLRGDGDSPVYIRMEARAVEESGGWKGRFRAAVIEITEQKHLEEQLRRRAEELETVMDVVPVAIWVAHDPKCHHITGNRAANEFYEAVTGENVSAGPAPGEPVPPRRFLCADRELSAEELPMQVAAAGNIDVRGAEFDVQVESGRQRTLWGYASPLRDASGSVRGAVGAFVDITERKKAEEALRKSEERFRLLTENASDVILILDPVGSILYASPSVTQAGGFTPEELIGTSVLKLTHPDDLPLVMNALSTAAAHPEERITLEVRIRHSSGDWLIFDVIGVNLLEEPAVQGFVVNARDITDRRRAEEALRESEEKYRNLVENSIDAVLLTAPDGSVYAANAEACRIFGMAEEELIRRGRDGIVDPSDPRLRPALEERARTGRFKGELRFRRKDGTTFPGEVSSALYTDRDGQVRTTMIIRDITDRKRTEEALVRRTEDLTRKSREVEAARDEANLYLDIMTHDIRNANNVSTMYADLMVDLAEGDLKTYVEKLRGSILRGNGILQNVATIRRVHEESASLAPVSLDAVIREEIGNFPGASIRYDGQPVEVSADGLLPMIFANLIGNAVKFGGPGVEITVRVEEQDGEVLVSVEDTGPGIPDEVKEKLFTRFERGMGRGRGEGLGLYIVRTLVERYGGEVRVEDRGP